MKKDGLREMGFDVLSVARQNSLLDGSRGTGLSICLKCTKPLVRNLSRSVAGYHIPGSVSVRLNVVLQRIGGLQIDGSIEVVLVYWIVTLESLMMSVYHKDVASFLYLIVVILVVSLG